MPQVTPIAGEPLEVLERLLPDIRYEKLADGWFEVSFSTDPETGAAWHRAVERRAADLIVGDPPAPLKSRYASAFVELIQEVVAVLDKRRHEPRPDGSIPSA